MRTPITSFLWITLAFAAIPPRLANAQGDCLVRVCYKEPGGLHPYCEFYWVPCPGLLPGGDEPLKGERDRPRDICREYFPPGEARRQCRCQLYGHCHDNDNDDDGGDLQPPSCPEGEHMDENGQCVSSDPCVASATGSGFRALAAFGGSKAECRPKDNDGGEEATVPDSEQQRPSGLLTPVINLFFPDRKCSGEGYGDVNVTPGKKGLVATGGGMLRPEGGVYPYLGGGIGTPGVSLTMSPGQPSPGFNLGAQFTFLPPIAVQFGYGAFGRDGSLFFEFGGATPGFSITGYWVFDCQ